MSSLPPTPKSYSLQFAERIHYTTGKDQLTRICVGGFLLESLWHSVIERRVFKTPIPVVRKSMYRAAMMWPAIYIVTTAAISWAAWKVNQAERTLKEKDQRDF
ncbi:hypothetical protein GGR58DRAFT_140438 [Xylaria digitata]|nr:hypothetical protein GGR58DRAFT_140438 [Xylaria digitata]